MTARRKIVLINPQGMADYDSSDSYFKPKKAKKKKKPTAKKTVKKTVKKASTKKRSSKVATKKAPKKKQSGVRKRVTVYKGKSGVLYAPRRRGRYKPALKRGTKINPRRTRRNPSFSLKRVLNTKLVIKGGLIAGGFIGGSRVAKLIRDKVPQLGKLGKFAGVLNIGLGLVAASLTRRDEIKSVSLGIIAGGVTDIISANLPEAAQAPSPEAVEGMLGTSSSLLGADSTLLGMDYASDSESDDYYLDMD